MITNEQIKELAESENVYYKGLMYANNGRVTNLKVDKVNNAVHAKVIGNDIYNTSVSFEGDEQVYDFNCTCSYHQKYSCNGCCKHVVAVLKTLQSQEYSVKESKVKSSLEKTQEKVVIQLINNINLLNQPKTVVRLHKTVCISIGEYDETSNVFIIPQLRVGLQKIYIIKNIINFYENIKSQEVQMGKTFTFDRSKHRFSKRDYKFLQYVYSNYSRIYGQNSSKNSFHVIDRALYDTYIKGLLELLKEEKIDLKVIGENDVDESEIIQNVRICQDELPIAFNLEKQEEGLKLSYNLDYKIYPLTSDLDYVYFDNKIYNLPDYQREILEVLYKDLINSESKCINIPDDIKQSFMVNVLPPVKSAIKVEIDTKLQDEIIEKELYTKIYFDKASSGISVKIEFLYDKYLINPLINNNNLLNNKILIRNIKSEREILNIFTKSGFELQDNRLVLDDEQKIYEFVSEQLPMLQESYELYYSDDFKKIQIKRPSAFTGAVRLNKDSELLEINLKHEDIELSELQNVLNSLRLNKKYHRLKDGSFLMLESNELSSMLTLIDNLDITIHDIGEDTIRLPKYRAMYLDNFLRDNNLSHITRNSGFKELVQDIKEPQDIEFEIPEEVDKVLRGYQKTGFKWLKTLSKYGFGGILADDMGIGKTLQVISFILSEREKSINPCLVIAPTSLVYNWQDEVKKFAPSLKTLIVTGAQSTRKELIQQISEVDIIITSYPLIRRDIEVYENIEFAYCFLDEAQHIKNPNTQNAKSVNRINARGYFALTGTPIENSLTELWSIFNYIMPGYLYSHNGFISKFESPIVKDRDKEAGEDLARLIKPFILRRMKKDVLDELPEKIETKVLIEMTSEQKKLYLAYLKQAKGEIEDEIKTQGVNRSKMKIIAALTRLRQICCHPALFVENYNDESGKLQMLDEILRDTFESGHRVLLFSQFTSMLGIIKNYLDQNNIEYFYLDGQTPTELRTNLVREFNEGEVKIFLISLKAGGTGLNLTGADVVIHFDPWWNPAVEEQATDRAYRIGQKNAVQVIKLITQGTIEEKIYELQQKKKEMIDNVIRAGESIITSMSEDDIKQLFEI